MKNNKPTKPSIIIKPGPKPGETLGMPRTPRPVRPKK